MGTGGHWGQVNSTYVQRMRPERWSTTVYRFVETFENLARLPSNQRVSESFFFASRWTKQKLSLVVSRLLGS
jgi:hypothetical protein